MKRKWMAVVMVCAMLTGTQSFADDAKKAEPAAKPEGSAPAAVQPPVAGSSLLGVTVTELSMVVNGWSVKKQLMGKEVYNDKNVKVGSVEDVIVNQDKAISYGILSVGGFLGIDKHDVAIPVNQFKMKDGKITLPGATKDAITALPKFQYAK